VRLIAICTGSETVTIKQRILANVEHGLEGRNKGGVWQSRSAPWFRYITSMLDRAEWTGIPGHDGWKSEEARIRAIGPLALAQYGSRDIQITDQPLLKELADIAVRNSLPAALRAAASRRKSAKIQAKLLASSERCAQEGSLESVRAARKGIPTRSLDLHLALTNAEYVVRHAKRRGHLARLAIEDAILVIMSAAEMSRERDKVLAAYAADIVQVLVRLNSPGCRFLDQPARAAAV
jgi:hypothetical protein